MVSGKLQIKKQLKTLCEWNLLDFPVQLEGFNIRETVNSFEIDLNIEDQELKYGQLGRQQIQFSDMPTLITENDLLNWLDRKVRRQGLHKSNYELI
jgi:type III restriction enzyme